MVVWIAYGTGDCQSPLRCEINYNGRVMHFNPDLHHRRSIRYKGYDYAQSGAYFVTVISAGRECLFGELVDGVMQLSPFGEIVREEWFRSAQIREEIVLSEHEFVVMPNHAHGIVWIIATDDRNHGEGVTGQSPLPHQTNTSPRGPRPKSLSSFIVGFKSSVTKRINAMRSSPGDPVWQRNYYERIIRNDDELRHIQSYIAENPLRWHLDRENPMRQG